MVLKQYYLDGLAHTSYLIADEDSGRAAVVDPQRDVEQYLEDAAALGCRIGHVFLTHLHADFVAGHLELRERAGAVIHLAARAEAEYPFKGMSDGDSVRLGEARLTAMETPGHSPEGISILIYDPAYRKDEPYAVLTGDTLFIGDVGRPDLRAALGWNADELASMLYDSLHEKLARLPDDTLVYPAHGAGSLCGKNISTETVSTIGIQRSYNPGMAPMSREQFIEMVTADLPDAPPYFTYDAIVNARERLTFDHVLERALRPLTLPQTIGFADGGAQLLDTRDAAKFETAHLTGSVNVGLDGSYSTWCGTILNPEQPIVLIAEPGREREAATGLGRIGFDTIAGYLAGGIDAVEGEPRALETTSRINAASLVAQLSSPEPPLLIDVRTPPEWEQQRIHQAVNIPLATLAQHLDALSHTRPLVVYCATGYRSAIAASVLKREGFRRVSDLAGGLSSLGPEALTRT